ncbi:MAG TPA: PLP-dependent aspartate aminotransferase family protein [Candidatus Kapabacteria bacterium]|nr:PLP-dependent aspartate aminotransferase family protein [Candidatus Kapabacteria bacterium]
MTIETRLTLAGQRTDGTYNSVAPPIYQTATFRFEGINRTKGYDYTRSGNPTRSALEDALADLEGGAGAVAVSSGMAAISTVLATFNAGDHIICSHDCYGGTERLLCTLRSQGKLEVTFSDLRDPLALLDAVQPNSRAVWVETPSNPLLRIVDLEAIAGFARSHGLLLIVDNTFLSPLFQQPIAFGADVVVHSTTKYINGHSDVVGGAVISRTEELHRIHAATANTHGTTAAPFDSWLVLRGLRTLPLRIRQHEANALAVARFLESHPAVERVFYPGLESHEGHRLAARQQNGFGGVVSFQLRGSEEALHTLLLATQVFALAESLGGVESLIEHPATMSHASMRPEQRAAAGINDRIIRLSVGIESECDLIADLAQALDAAALQDAAHASAVLVDGDGGVAAEALHV